MVGTVSYAQWLSRGAIAFLVLVISPLCAFAVDAAKGEIVAKRWCAACHLVSSDQKLAKLDMPSFATIARRKLPSEELTAFLTNSHPKVPNMNLSRSEIEDVIAYIGSLDR